MRRFLFAVLWLWLGACSGGSGAVTRQPNAPRATPAVPDSLVGPWAIRGAERPRAQRVDVEAVIESRVDSTLRADTLATRAWYDWSENPAAASRRVAGMVRAFAVRRGADSLWQVLDAPALPVSFVAELPWAGSAPELLLPRADGCDAQAVVAQGWRETWVSPPERVSVGTRWQDSSETSFCRDGIVLRARTLREFVVEGAVVRHGALRLVVRRATRGSLAGSGVQFGDSVHFVGTTSGSARLELLPDGAIIADGAGSSELRLTMRGRRRTQELVQRSALAISVP